MRDCAVGCWVDACLEEELKHAGSGKEQQEDAEESEVAVSSFTSSDRSGCWVLC